MIDFGEDLGPDCILAGFGDLLIGFRQFLYQSHLKNEVFMRQLGRRVEEHQNI